KDFRIRPPYPACTYPKPDHICREDPCVPKVVLQSSVFWPPCCCARPHADEDGNPLTSADPDWKPLFSAPPYLIPPIRTTRRTTRSSAPPRLKCWPTSLAIGSPSAPR